AGMLCATLPAVRAMRPHLAGRLSATTAAAATTPSHRRLHGALIALEVGLTFVLLMGAALLANSFVRMTRVDVGFDPRNLATVRLQLPDRYRSRETQDALFETLIARVRTLPGVRAVTTGTDMPPAEGGGIAISANGVEART